MQNQRDREAKGAPVPVFRYALAATVAEPAKVALANSGAARSPEIRNHWEDLVSSGGHRDPEGAPGASSARGTCIKCRRRQGCF